MTILNIRHPVDVVASLEGKVYRDEGGSLKEKLQALERTFCAREQFDLTIFYEDFTRDPKRAVRQLSDVGIALPAGAEEFPRKPASIISAARASSEWCDLHYNDGWGLGNAHLDAFGNLASINESPTYPVRDDARTWTLALEACPNLVEYYVEFRNYGPSDNFK